MHKLSPSMNARRVSGSGRADDAGRLSRGPGGIRMTRTASILRQGSSFVQRVEQPEVCRRHVKVVAHSGTDPHEPNARTCDALASVRLVRLDSPQRIAFSTRVKSTPAGLVGSQTSPRLIGSATTAPSCRGGSLCESLSFATGHDCPSAASSELLPRLVPSHS